MGGDQSLGLFSFVIVSPAQLSSCWAAIKTKQKTRAGSLAMAGIDFSRIGGWKPNTKAPADLEAGESPFLAHR